MKLNRITWVTFSVLSFLSLLVWFKFSYPQLAFIHFAIDQRQAVDIAKAYLHQRGNGISDFRKAVVFTSDEAADRYLQKTLGFRRLIDFIHEHDFDMFFWVVRFFKENETEEYRLAISPTTGQVTSFKHRIRETEAREKTAREDAKKRVVQFLREEFGFDSTQYVVKGDLETTYDRRSEFSFTWQKRSVQIPWNDEKDGGTGKLVTGGKIAGREILSFAKNTFHVPEDFDRYLDRVHNTGRNLSTIVGIFHLALLVVSIFFIVVRRNHLSMHTAKKFYLGVVALSFFLSLASSANQFEQILFNYNTTGPFYDYLWRLGVNTVLTALFVSVTIIIPALSGETLHYEVFGNRKGNSFLYYIRSTFFSRSVAQLIVLGYFTWFIMLGIQSLLIYIGQRHWGIWIEHTWIENFSTAYLPFLAAFTLGFKAGFSEELMFRLFAISLGKKIFKSTLLAVILSSLIWGFSHSGYPVFPMWFRGIEVTFLGFFLSFMFLRYGIIPVIVGHFLFDVFWQGSGYLLNPANNFYFYSSLSVLLVPLVLGIIAFLINRAQELKPMRWYLNRHQRYNLEILKTFLQVNREQFKNKSNEDIKKEIASCGWDIAVIETALDDREL